MYIYELIPDINLEDEQTEFKAIIKEGEYEQNGKKCRYEYGWLKEFVAFSNTNGGNFYIGVENKTHKIISYKHNGIDKLSLMIHRLVKQDITPSITYEIEAIKVDDNQNEQRYILKIKILKNKFIPVFLKLEGVSVCYVRHFNLTSIATPEEIVRLCYQNTSFSYDSLFTSIKFKKEDFKKLFEFYFKIYNKELSNKELISIGFMDDEEFLSNGALMFKDDYHDESITLVSCTKFIGIYKGDSVFLNNQRFATNLLDEFEKISNFIASNNDHGFKKLSIGQKEVSSYPDRAITEAIINSLAHRNYMLTNSQIEVNVFRDRLEIISPGSLVSGKWLKNERNLKDIIPIRRNNVICSIFMMLKLMEEKGTGFDKIESEYQNEDFAHLPFLNSDSSSVSITLPNRLYDNGVVKINDFPKILVTIPLESKNDYRILSYCYFKEKSITDIANILKIKPSTYLRNNIKKLLNKDLLKIYKTGDNINKYLTNKDFVKLDY